METPIEDHLSYLGLNGSNSGSVFASSDWATAAQTADYHNSFKPTTGLGNSGSWLKKDSASMESAGSGDSHYGAVLRKQASELEGALIAKSDLESQVRHLTSELQSHKTKLMQKEAEFKAIESQLRQKASRLAAFENGSEPPQGAIDSADMMDLMAEKEALQDALKAAQLELAKEQAARVNAEAKLASGAAAGSSVSRRGVEESKEVAALREQLEGEQAEVAALQEALRRAEQQCSAAHKQTLGLREEQSATQSKLSEAEAQIEHLADREKHLERVAEAKDKTIRELTERVEKRIVDTMQFNGAGKIGEEEMWKLGLTHEQLSAIDQIIVKWRDGYNRKDQELYEVSTMLREREEQVSRITGIVRRTMDSIRAGYQRTSAEGAIMGGSGERDDALLDVARFENVEDMLGSLAQFAANKSHAALRLQQELRRKADEIVQLEDEVQRGWSMSHKESELEYVRRELAEKTSEAAELRISLGRKGEEAAAALVEVRVLNEEVAAGRETVNHLRNQLSAAEADVARVRQETSHMAVQDVSRMREELERAHAEVIPLKEQLNRRTREVRELNHMLKAWEAMRLGKDAQIASLMERCKRHEEEAAEKARSVDSLRRKLALAGRDPSLGSSVSGASGSRSRHIHVHMHHQPSESGSEYEYGGSIGPGSLRSSHGP